MRIRVVRKDEDFPTDLNRQKLAEFLHKSLKPFEDALPDVLGGVNHALSTQPGEGGFILIGETAGRIAGALVMLRTGMKGFLPENLLLFVAVASSMRRKGIGAKLVVEGIKLSDGDVKLHVEHANPAKRLYSRLGFTNEYAEMRHVK